LAPHLGNHGGGNTAWIDEFEGTPILFAQREGSSLALASSAGWLKRSAGYVGSSDGWQDLKAHKKMTSEYTRAKNGNVALTGEIDLSASQGNFTLSLGFGNDPANAARNAIATLHEGFEQGEARLYGWLAAIGIKQHSSQHNNGHSPNDLSQTSLAVLRTARVQDGARSFHCQPIDSMGIQQG
jgi:GH15 family glucan-1,4-alpha-glucosidase